MKRFVTLLAAALLVLAVALVTTTPAAAQDSETRSEAERQIQEGLAAVLEGLGLFMESIPRYEMPEILPNGDILIRRIPSEKDDPQWKDEGPDRGGPVETEDKGKAI